MYAAVRVIGFPTVTALAVDGVAYAVFVCRADGKLRVVGIADAKRSAHIVFATPCRYHRIDGITYAIQPTAATVIGLQGTVFPVRVKNAFCLIVPWIQTVDFFITT